MKINPINIASVSDRYIITHSGYAFPATTANLVEVAREISNTNPVLCDVYGEIVERYKTISTMKSIPDLEVWESRADALLSAMTYTRIEIERLSDMRDVCWSIIDERKRRAKCMRGE